MSRQSFFMFTGAGAVGAGAAVARPVGQRQPTAPYRNSTRSNEIRYVDIDLNRPQYMHPARGECSANKMAGGVCVNIIDTGRQVTLTRMPAGARTVHKRRLNLTAPAQMPARSSHSRGQGRPATSIRRQSDRPRADGSRGGIAMISRHWDAQWRNQQLGQRRRHDNHGG